MGLTYNVMPVPRQFFVDANGAPYAGGKVYFWQSGGLTVPQDTYADSIGTPNANPVVLDASGRAPIYLAPKAYAVELRDANGVQIWTQDPVYGYNAFDVLGVAGEAIAANTVVYLSDGSGGKTAGNWYKADLANNYSCTMPVIGMAPSAINSAATGTIRVIGQLTGLAGLVGGTSYYVGAAGALSTTVGLRRVGVADTTTSITIEPNPAPATKRRTLYRSVTAVSAGFPGETTLATYTMPASTMSANGDTVIVRAWGTNAANGNTKTWRIYFGATVVLLRAGGVNAAPNDWYIEAEVARTAAATQMAHGTWNGQSSGTLFTRTTPAETLSGTVVIKITGESGTAANDITLELASIEIVPTP